MSCNCFGVNAASVFIPEVDAYNQNTGATAKLVDLRESTGNVLVAAPGQYVTVNVVVQSDVQEAKEFVVALVMNGVQFHAQHLALDGYGRNIASVTMVMINGDVVFHVELRDELNAVIARTPMMRVAVGR